MSTPKRSKWGHRNFSRYGSSGGYGRKYGNFGRRERYNGDRGNSRGADDRGFGGIGAYFLISFSVEISITTSSTILRINVSSILIKYIEILYAEVIGFNLFYSLNYQNTVLEIPADTEAQGIELTIEARTTIIMKGMYQVVMVGQNS